MVSMADGTLGSASTTTRRVGAAVSSRWEQLFPGWDLSWMEKVSVLAVADLSLPPPHLHPVPVPRANSITCVPTT